MDDCFLSKGLGLTVYCQVSVRIWVMLEIGTNNLINFKRG